VLLCDEPTGALDATTGKLVLSVIQRIHRELGTATAIITHNAPIAAMADRVITLSEGLKKSDVVNAHKLPIEEIFW
jgi:putative ABC transport system ATP-binding protein